MGQFIRHIAWTGFGASVGLCLFDLVTSIMGIRIILGSRSDSFIAICMPVIFATLALCFNGLSAYMFRMFMQQDFTSFTTRVTCIMWICFVVYDAVSAFVGMLDTYATQSVNSLSAIFREMNNLGVAGSFFVIVMATLLSFGPFLCCMFYELARSQAEI